MLETSPTSLAVELDAAISALLRSAWFCSVCNNPPGSVLAALFCAVADRLSAATI